MRCFVRHSHCQTPKSCNDFHLGWTSIWDGPSFPPARRSGYLRVFRSSTRFCVISVTRGRDRPYRKELNPSPEYLLFEVPCERAKYQPFFIRKQTSFPLLSANTADAGFSRSLAVPTLQPPLSTDGRDSWLRWDKHREVA